jgi:hypothetical protein
MYLSSACKKQKIIRDKNVIYRRIELSLYYAFSVLTKRSFIVLLKQVWVITQRQIYSVNIKKSDITQKQPLSIAI